jgi:cell division septation protein DedD
VKESKEPLAPTTPQAVAVPLVDRKEAVPVPTATPAVTPTPTPTTTTPTPTPTPAVSPYATQLAALEAMGFTNRELNAYLLDRNRGNVQAVANWLIEKMRE